VSKGKRRWHLSDLKSTNGTYVRISHATLEHQAEFIIGRTRFRFDDPRLANAAPQRAGSAGEGATRPWPSNSNQAHAASLVEVGADGDGRRLIIAEKEIWIGKDAHYCQLVLGDDPFASARHARLHLDKDGRWQIENNKSVNGVWLRINRLALHDTCRFLLGEQQFLVRIPT
jgi:pSer/pThr/pTyr-binding forkhead associated (FHA) protein